MRAALSAIALSTAVLAEEAPEPLPDFATCMDQEVARFERALRRLAEVPDLEPFEAGGTTEVAYCGGVGIVLCDRSGDAVPCQHALVSEQDQLNAAVRAGLPAPEAVAASEDPLARSLYPQLHALAHGTSAEPDCGGTEAAFGAWCAAWAANDVLRVSIRTWELARYLGAAPDAVTTGWARVPPPTRPKAREGVE
jgi:hypothetical protein